MIKTDRSEFSENIGVLLYLPSFLETHYLPVPKKQKKLLFESVCTTLLFLGSFHSQVL